MIPGKFLESKDVSFKSINMLEKRFAEYRQRKIWVPDWGYTSLAAQEDEVDVVIMGSFYERLFQIDFWPEGDFFLFCLSPRVKRVLIELFGMNPRTIGHISRYELFPLKSPPLERFTFKENDHLYYAGRLSPQKNIEFLVFFTFYLQILLSSDVKLSLFGDFDSEYHKDIKGCLYQDYEKKINKLIDSLPWPGEKPSLTTGLNEQQWLKDIPKRGLFVSASNLISEDFSVTAAQLQQAGRAMLLPLWGGLGDVVGENVRHYSSSFIGHSHLSLREVRERAKVFASACITEDIFITSSEVSETVIPDLKLNREMLTKLYLENQKKWGREVNFLAEKNLPAFVATKTGQVFFRECRRLFAHETSLAEVEIENNRFAYP